MAVYRRSNRHRFILVLLVLTSITLLTLDERADQTGIIGGARSAARDALAPVQSGVSSLVRPVGNFFSTATGYRDLASENARLKRRVEELRGENLRGTDAVRERDALLELARLGFAGDIPTVAARVVSNSPSNLQQTVEIDHGSGSGVGMGMPVATAGGLVGRVVAVSRHSATVLLITDPAFAAGIRLSDSGDVGVAKGAGRRQPLSLDLIDVGTRVSAGEIVVTSGLQQSVFPPNVPVGKVRSARALPGLLAQEVKLDPVADVGRLQFVRVLQWSRDEASARTLQ